MSAVADLATTHANRRRELDEIRKQKAAAADAAAIVEEDARAEVRDLLDAGYSPHSRELMAAWALFRDVEAASTVAHDEHLAAFRAFADAR